MTLRAVVSESRGPPQDPEHDPSTRGRGAAEPDFTAHRYNGLTFGGLLVRAVLATYLPCVVGALLAEVQASSVASRTFFAVLVVIPGWVGAPFGRGLGELFGTPDAISYFLAPYLCMALLTGVALRLAWISEREGGWVRFGLGGLVALWGGAQAYAFTLQARA